MAANRMGWASNRRVRDTIGDTARLKIFIGYGFRAARHRRLEYQWASALLGSLAGPLKFAAAVCQRSGNRVAAFGGKC
ncbi:MAG: hypothetical protein ABSH08_16800 [Tepidisphaeraceae bacterium]